MFDPNAEVRRFTDGQVMGLTELRDRLFSARFWQLLTDNDRDFLMLCRVKIDDE